MGEEGESVSVCCAGVAVRWGVLVRVHVGAAPGKHVLVRVKLLAHPGGRVHLVVAGRQERVQRARAQCPEEPVLVEQGCLDGGVEPRDTTPATARATSSWPIQVDGGQFGFVCLPARTLQPPPTGRTFR